MSLVAFQKHDAVVVGQPTPFSIYDVEGKLLLAKNLPVTDERLREIVITKGTYMASPESDTGAAQLPVPSAPSGQPSVNQSRSAPPTAAPSDLSELRRRYANDDERSRFGLRIARDERSESFASFVLGVINDKRYVILTAPVNKYGAIIPIAKGEVWMCRLFNATTVFRFMSRIVKVAHEPVPYLHVELPKNIERRMVRQQPRALASLPSTLHGLDGKAAIIVDISTSGMRLAVDADTQLEKDSLVPICTTITMMERVFSLILNGRVTAVFGASDTDFPNVHFYGIQMELVDDTTALILHAYVHEQLALELDRLSRVLAIETAYENAALKSAAPTRKK